jgi:adenylate kinase
MAASVLDRVRTGLRQLTVEQLRRIAEEAAGLLKEREAEALIDAHRDGQRCCPECRD